jgi:di/tricarboxylate transporter
VVAALAGAVAMVLTGCLRLSEFLDSIHWDIILLLAGVIPLGLALEKSGAADLLAGGLVRVGGLVPPLLFLMLAFLVTSIITEVVSNNASVVLLLPVVVAAAAALGLNPTPFALAVMISASTSMLTPIGYQTNTMVYAPGAYRFGDYLRVGGPLNLMLAVVLPLVIAYLFPLAG